MIIAPINHISLDERGIPYIAGTAVKVADVAIDAERWGLSPLEIRDNYPRLSLAQIHAALAYYHDHTAVIEAQIAVDAEEYTRLRAANPNPLTRAQFEARLPGKTADEPRGE
jgi:uncharacterized protein (DUF433 family)